MVLVEETIAWNTPGWECPGEDQEMRPLAGTSVMNSLYMVIYKCCSEKTPGFL